MFGEIFKLYVCMRDYMTWLFDSCISTPLIVICGVQWHSDTCTTDIWKWSAAPPTYFELWHSTHVWFPWTCTAHLALLDGRPSHSITICNQVVFLHAWFPPAGSSSSFYYSQQHGHADKKNTQTQHCNFHSFCTRARRRRKGTKYKVQVQKGTKCVRNARD